MDVYKAAGRSMGKSRLNVWCWVVESLGGRTGDRSFVSALLCVSAQRMVAIIFGTFLSARLKRVGHANLWVLLSMTPLLHRTVDHRRNRVGAPRQLGWMHVLASLANISIVSLSRKVPAWMLMV